LIRSVRARAFVRGVSAFVTALARRTPEVEQRLPERAALIEEAPRAGVDNRCPVCRARFRGARICSRCGAELEPLMRLTVKAWQLRESARRALQAGDVGRALGLANEAQAIQGAGSGGALRLLCAWLTTGGLRS